MSGNKPTEEITLARMRYACMYKPLNEELAGFNIKNLANDMNGLGANIRLRGRSNDQICNEIMEFVPNVDAVCARGKVSKGKGAENAIHAMAEHFNKTYHSGIIMNDQSTGKKRSAPELCADLYQQADRIFDNLTENPTKVKKKLSTAIENLVHQKQMLEAIFASHLNGLGDSAGLDKLQGEMKKSKQNMANMIKHLERDVTAADEFYGDMVQEMESEMIPSIREYQDQFEAIAKRNYRNTDSQKILIANDIMNVGKLVGLAANKCSKCLNKFNINVTEYMDGDNFDNVRYQNDVTNSAHKLIDEGYEREYVKQCEANLLSQREECARSSTISSALTYGMPDERCALLNLDDAGDKEKWKSYGCDVYGSVNSYIDEGMEGTVSNWAEAIENLATEREASNENSYKSMLSTIIDNGASGLGSSSSSSGSKSDDYDGAYSMFEASLGGIGLFKGGASGGFF